MRERGSAVFLLIATFALAACTSDRATPTTTTSPAATTTSVTTTAGPTTALAPPTTPVTTAPSTTTTSSTTTPSTTSSAPPPSSTAPEEQAVRQAIQDFERDYSACGVDPPLCDPSSFLASEGPALEIAQRSFSQMAAAGQHFATGDASRIIPRTVTFDSSTKATVVSCLYDAGVVLGRPGPSGVPTVINDEIASYTSTHVLYREAGRWRVGEEKPFVKLGEGDLCPPA